MKVTELRCNGLYNPIGLKRGGKLRFSWKITSPEQDTYQESYHIKVWEKGSGSIIWDTDAVKTEHQLAVMDMELQSNTEYQWSVEVSDNHGCRAVGGPACFMPGLAQEEWTAKWIGLQKKDLDSSVKMATKKEMAEAFLNMVSGTEDGFKPDRTLNPCYIFRKIVKTEPAKDIKKAFLAVTAHGLYDIKINGKAVTESRLNPGFTSYEKYLEYQTYDVAGYLTEEENIMTITLADGWYRGKFGILGYGNNYGTETAVLAQLDIFYEDESRECVVTDESYRYTESAVRYSDIMIGEKQDLRLDAEVWNEAGYDDSSWTLAEVKPYGYENLNGICAEPVRYTKEQKPKEIMVSPKGELIVDFGQVLVGVVRLWAEGTSGTEIKLEHTEVLDRDGNFINNVSGYNRDQTDYFVLSGKRKEKLEPLFTFHGFRYVRISGYPGKLNAESVCAKVLGSDLAAAGTFSCSDERLNQLQSNISWSQRGNMVSIPTDCPQRERAGWTGDILVYGNTAVYNQNTEQFLRKWLANMRCEQFDNGLIPVVIPYPFGYSAMQEEAFGTDTSAGWGDAAVIVPWILYQEYADPEILRENFEMAKGWMDFVEKNAAGGIPEFSEELSEERRERQKYLWNTGFHFGDWCYPSCKNEKGETDMFRSAYTTKEHVATAMYANSANVMASICEVLGKQDLSEYYRDLNRKIRKAFSDEYVNEDGSIEHAVQGIYVLALAMNLADEEKKQAMAHHLADMIRDNGCRLDTGFLSVPYLMDVLADHRYQDLAKVLLYQEDCPSWLYAVKKGATTIWETWNAILEDGTPTSNSYNHYAFGCIGSWMYRTLCGIQPLEPGYRKVRISPDFSYGLTSAEGSHDTIYGWIRCEWELSKSQGRLKAVIPVGIQAEICLPGVHCFVGSGTYSFTFQSGTVDNAGGKNQKL